MRVLMISLDRRLLGQGGRANDVVERHQRYADLAGSLDVIVFANSDYGPKIWSHNFRVFPTGSRKFSHFRKATAIASKLISEQSYDLLVTQDLASPVGKKIKEKFSILWLVTIHSMFFSKEWLDLNVFKWYLYFLIKKAILGADGFRVVNPKIKDRLQKWKVKKPILVLPTPVDIKNFFIADKPKNIVPIILYVGRLTPEKNVGMLISAARGIEASLRLQIVGEGPEAKRLKKLAGQDARVIFLGTKSHEDLISIYREADIFILPSNTESFGWVLLEASAARCAIIATRTPGASTIIKNGETGMLIEIGSKQDLKSALESLLQNPDLRKRLGQNASEMAGRYDSEKAILTIVKFWKQIAQKP